MAGVANLRLPQVVLAYSQAPRLHAGGDGGNNQIARGYIIQHPADLLRASSQPAAPIIVAPDDTTCENNTVEPNCRAVLYSVCQQIGAVTVPDEGESVSVGVHGACRDILIEQPSNTPAACGRQQERAHWK